jgi:hypothetical protein
VAAPPPPNTHSLLGHLPAVAVTALARQTDNDGADLFNNSPSRPSVPSMTRQKVHHVDAATDDLGRRRRTRHSFHDYHVASAQPPHLHAGGLASFADRSPPVDKTGPVCSPPLLLRSRAADSALAKSQKSKTYVPQASRRQTRTTHFATVDEWRNNGLRGRCPRKARRLR